ncbi:MAG TPA: PKD domain-containing protein [Solirubrobacteraceae bacterium]
MLLSSALALAVAAPAGAVVTEVSGTRVGLQPRSEKLGEPSAPAAFGNEAGNAVVHGANVYGIYWDPGNGSTTGFHHEWITDIDTFLQQLGAGSGSLGTIFSSLGQYRDRTNQPAVYATVDKGTYSDTAKYPTAGCTDPNPLVVGQVTCLTDAQIREQLQTFIAREGLPKGMNFIYYVMTPPGVTVCLDAAATHCSDYEVSALEEEQEAEADIEPTSVSYKNSFCSYHSDINPDAAPEGDANTILYAAIPWTAGSSGLAGYVPSAFSYVKGVKCQDGGWSPINGKGENQETREHAKEPTEAETKEEAEANEEQLRKIENRRRLESPHIEEPNQEGKGEMGDNSPGLADLIINQIAEEQANTVTDPLLNGWQDSEGHEVTDRCRNTFASLAGAGIGGALVAEESTEAGTLSNTMIGKGSYYVNNVYSLSKNNCTGGVGLIPRFTAPNPVNSSEIVLFDGMESTVGLDQGLTFGPTGPPTKTYATFSWNFGDGTPEVKGFAPGAPLCETPWLSPCAASIAHAYQYGGTYQVTLTVVDVAGNASQVAHEVTVSGPPAPKPGTTTPGGSSSGAANTAAIPAPVAAALIISRSLKKALHSGIEIRYSVNEQVAGRFQLLLSKSIARKLHISGTAATGLPAGTSAQIVLASHVLVTTKGGRSVLVIKLPKSTAKKLSHLKSASLLLRLSVHNASKSSPQTTTVLSKVTLSH